MCMCVYVCVPVHQLASSSLLDQLYTHGVHQTPSQLGLQEDKREREREGGGGGKKGRAGERERG